MVEKITPLADLSKLMRIYWDGNDALTAEEKKAAAIKFYEKQTRNPGHF